MYWLSLIKTKPEECSQCDFISGSTFVLGNHKIKSLKYSREDKHHAMNCLRQFLAMCCRDCLKEGEYQTPLVRNQGLPSLFRLCDKEKSDGRVTSSVNSSFSSTEVILSFKKLKTNHSAKNTYTQKTSTDTAVLDQLQETVLGDFVIQM